MKTAPNSMHPGDQKLRGRHSKLLNCGCCEMRNWRWTEKLKQARDEILGRRQGNPLQ